MCNIILILRSHVKYEYNKYIGYLCKLTHVEQMCRSTSGARLDRPFISYRKKTTYSPKKDETDKLKMRR